MDCERFLRRLSKVTCCRSQSLLGPKRLPSLAKTGMRPWRATPLLVPCIDVHDLPLHINIGEYRILPSSEIRAKSIARLRDVLYLLLVVQPIYGLASPSVASQILKVRTKGAHQPRAESFWRMRIWSSEK